MYRMIFWPRTQGKSQAAKIAAQVRQQSTATSKAKPDKIIYDEWAQIEKVMFAATPKQ